MADREKVCKCGIDIADLMDDVRILESRLQHLTKESAIDKIS